MTLVIQAGIPLRKGVPVLDSANQPVPMTDEWSARAQVREHETADVVLHEWTTEGLTPNAEIDTVNGRIVLTATAVQTAAFAVTWPVLTPVWDLIVTDAAGEPHKLPSDVVSVELTITRD